MGQLGADVEALDRLSKKFNEESEKIRQAVSQITSQVQGVWWKGQDAEKFKGEWNGQYKAQLTKVADALKQIGEIVKKQAQQQRDTSKG